MRNIFITVVLVVAMTTAAIYLVNKPKTSQPEALRPAEAVTIAPQTETLEETPVEEKHDADETAPGARQAVEPSHTITIPEKLAEIPAEIPISSSVASNSPLDSETIPEIPEEFSNTPQGALTEKMDSTSGPRFSFDFLAGEAVTTQSGTRSFTEFLAEGMFRIDNRSHVGIGQEARKLYEIAAVGEQEFLVDDTRLFYDYELTPEFLGSQWNVETGVTLPVSKISSDTKNITRASVALHIKKELFDKQLALSVSPLFEYSFNRYATYNGVPLQKMVFGAQAQADWEIIPSKLNFVAWGKGYYRMYEEYDFSSTTPAATTSFGLGTYFKYRITPNIAPQIGMSRGSTILQNIRYDSAFYDPEATRFYVALEIAF